ncbi:Homeodomain-like domain-containing protein [Burkholderia sp. D7]|nr:Homeodomain-like domain-containing protein [Burkholderia sp. D7]
MATRLSPEAWFHIEDLYRSGLSAKQIAKRYGVSPSTVHHRSALHRWRDTARAAKPALAERLEQAVDRLETILKRMPGGNQ